jgi:hypothetical protein
MSTITWGQYVDAEAVCVSALTGLGATVQQIGAVTNSHNIVEEAQVQVDVRAGSKKVARDAAYDARARLIDLPLTTSVGLVSIVQGPLWFPEPDGDPRYVVTVTITSRIQPNP